MGEGAEGGPGGAEDLEAGEGEAGAFVFQVDGVDAEGCCGFGEGEEGGWGVGGHGLVEVADGGGGWGGGGWGEAVGACRGVEVEGASLRGGHYCGCEVSLCVKGRLLMQCW